MAHGRVLTLWAMETHLRTHILLPKQTAKDIDALVGPRKRSAFLAELADREMRRLRLVKLFASGKPLWKDEDHPELKGGAAAYIRKMRRADDRHRMKKLR